MNMLTYIGNFGCRINRHKDSNPDMNVEAGHTSQLLGSSVMAVRFFDTQDLEFRNHYKAPLPCDVFRTEHMSVYILNSWDDLVWYHNARFVGGLQGKIRVSLIYRWLGRRTKVNCCDYAKRMQNCEIWRNPNKHIREAFPNCELGRNLYRVTRHNNKSLFPPIPVFDANIKNKL